MKFRRLMMVFIAGVVIAAFFTKPGKEDFQEYISRSVKAENIPVFEVNDKFLYTEATLTNMYIDSKAQKAHASKETYIGVFGKFWKL